MTPSATGLPVTLVIDTVRDRFQIALASSDGSVVSLSEAVARGHAEIIMDRIATLLARAGSDYAGIGRLAAVSGPGSFTGLRIGLSVARGLGLALAVPVLGIPTLTALSLSLKGRGVIALDARRDQAFLQQFSGPALPESELALVEAETARAAAGEAGFWATPVDIEALARFAQGADPAGFPPDPTYARAADAKPQTRFAVARA